MLLYFRLAICLLAGLFKPRIRVGEPASAAFRVLPTDTEYFVSLNATRFVSFSEIVQTENNLRSGVFRSVLRNRWWPVVRSHVVYYERPLRLFQRVRVTSRVLGWTERDFVWENVFEDVRGTRCAVSYTRGSVRGRTGVVPTSEVLAAAGVAEALREVEPAILALLESPHRRPDGAVRAPVPRSASFGSAPR